MANVFLSICQYKKLHETEVERIKKALRMHSWKSFLKPGFHPMFDESMRRMVNRNNHKFNICTVTGDGNLPRARSIIGGIWRHHYDIPEERCDYIMMIDDDLSWRSDAIDTLINDDKPIIGGIYTFKTDDPFYVGKVCTQFVDGETVPDDKCFRVRWLNGGFILVRTDAMLKMIEAYEDLWMSVDPENQLGTKKAWALWAPMLYELNGYRHFLGEDWAFCQRANDIGIEIWADLRPKLIHWNAENGYAIHL